MARRANTTPADATTPATVGASLTPGDAVSEPTTVVALTTEEDLLAVRHVVRAATLAAGFGLVDQTRVVTAASELARNAYIHGGGGTLTIEHPHRDGTKGVRLTISDEGPGIADPESALVDGYTTGAGLGHGLGGARRLMDDFEVHSQSGAGTTVIATRWAHR
ncbi:serine/threonine protein kinase [Streptomyces chryseus]|uniref:Serine/threonine protein kinase n=1 Tax=Streptomyces chryseus TaxID=68186 RepID=A0ABQ3DNS2_9ACTN|nr:serine/threonine protein kinase [Streptomyces chryseus]